MLVWVCSLLLTGLFGIFLAIRNPFVLEKLFHGAMYGMKKYQKDTVLIAGLMVVLGCGLIFSVFASRPASQRVLSEEELASLAQPAVVRIVQKVQGEIAIKPFMLDLETLKITAGSGPAAKLPVDDYTTGSGFIVGRDGYILTNSHVIAQDEIENQYITDAAIAALMDASVMYTGSKTDVADEAKMEEFTQKIAAYLKQESIFKLEKKMVVLDPSSKSDDIEELIAQGFPFEVLSFNGQYAKDGWDMALIKINQHDLPALPLGNDASLKRGERVGVFGFPATAELNQGNLLESTFSQGVISALKYSEHKDFNIIQTDAKVSSGSSGSPLLNRFGEVIGIMTYRTNAKDVAEGDSFAFAIPIDVVQSGIERYDVYGNSTGFSPGDYHAQFTDGLTLMHEDRCEKALVAFSRLKNMNEKFTHGNHSEPYEKKCREIEEVGQSVDNRWGEMRYFLRSLSMWTWAILGMILALFVAIALKLVFVKSALKKDEKEIEILEEELRNNEENEKREVIEIAKINEKLKKMEE